MRRLYIDFDGVVMDTIPPLYDALEKSNVDVYEEIQRRDFIAQFDFTTIVKDKNILNDSINSVSEFILLI